MNLPVCTVAFILLVLALRDVTISRANGASWQSFAQKFDFVGLYVYDLSFISTSLRQICRLLFMVGTGLLIVGFSFATSNGCKARLRVHKSKASLNLQGLRPPLFRLSFSDL